MSVNLDPIDVAILREAVRLDRLTIVDAGRIMVSAVQLADLAGRNLLVAKGSVFLATAAGRAAINE